MYISNQRFLSHVLLLGLVLAFGARAFGQTPKETREEQIRKFCEALEKTEDDIATPPVNKPEIDVAELYWKRKKKFALVVTAYKSPDSKSDLPFVEVDGDLIAKKLCALGYTVLGVLKGQDATKPNFRAALQRATSVTRPKDGLLLVYYSGHGVVDDRKEDLWLQTYDEIPGNRSGMSMPEVIKNGFDEKARGQLSVIIDSCFSGKAGLSATLTPEKLKNIILLSSVSGEDRVAYSITISKDATGNDITASAFSYYFSMVMNEWSKVDEDKDGIITYGELRSYTANKLACDYFNKKIPAAMEPGGFPLDSNEIFAFNAQMAKQFKTKVRKDLTRAEIERVQSAESQGVEVVEETGSDVQLDCDTLIQKSTSENAAPPTLNLSGFHHALGVNSPRLGNARAWQQDPGKPRSTTKPSIEVPRPTDIDKKKTELDSQDDATRVITSAKLAALFDENDSSYDAGLKATAEGRYEASRTLLTQSINEGSIDKTRVFRALGRNEIFAGQYQAAANWYKKALELQPIEKDVIVLNEAGNAFRLAGNYRTSETLFQSALSILESSQPDPNQSNMYALILLNLGRLYDDDGRYSRAEELYKRCLSVYQSKAINSPNRSTAVILNSLAGVYFSMEKYETALSYSQQAVAIMRHQVERESTSSTSLDFQGLAEALDGQGAILRQMGQLSEAQRVIEEALQINEVAFGPNHPAAADTFLNLAVLKSRKGDSVEAESLFLRALKIQEATLGADHPDVAVTLEYYAQFLISNQRDNEAAKIRQRAEQIRKSSSSTSKKNFFRKVLDTGFFPLFKIMPR